MSDDYSGNQFYKRSSEIFHDKNFYKNVLKGEGDSSNRLHKALSGFLSAKESEDRSLYRDRLITAYWEFIGKVVTRIKHLTAPRQFLLRFAALSPSLLSESQKKFICDSVNYSNSKEQIYYLDEWLLGLALGEVKASEGDEISSLKSTSQDKKNSLVEKRKGRMEASRDRLEQVLNDRKNLELEVKELIRVICFHEVRTDFENLEDGYSEVQRASIAEINGIMRKLSEIDKQVESLYQILSKEKIEVDQLELNQVGTLSDDGEIVANQQVLQDELIKIRQMAKMCIGRQGNQFPILVNQYFPDNMMTIAIREKVIAEINAVEEVDSVLFERSFKGTTIHVTPNILLLPCYGDIGVCWEPFEKFNRASGSGKLAVPMYSKDLRVAVITALADMRWQVAKESAQHRWMEEGLTGWYYGAFSTLKLKGDVRDAFIRDYILWITQEYIGIQKLDKEIRSIFWRLIPFPESTKKDLKTRGFVYSELYKKDLNRGKSDGY